MGIGKKIKKAVHGAFGSIEHGVLGVPKSSPSKPEPTPAQAPDTGTGVSESASFTLGTDRTTRTNRSLIKPSGSSSGNVPTPNNNNQPNIGLRI